ncbi:hypothetical protein NUSPORA_00717 [Nucleospora cyclopteri]
MHVKESNLFKNTGIHPNYSSQKNIESISIDFRMGLLEKYKKQDLGDLTLMEKKEETGSNTP